MPPGRLRRYACGEPSRRHGSVAVATVKSRVRLFTDAFRHCPEHLLRTTTQSRHVACVAVRYRAGTDNSKCTSRHHTVPLKVIFDERRKSEASRQERFGSFSFTLFFLTGGYNRRTYHQQLGEEVRAANDLSRAHLFRAAWVLSMQAATLPAIHVFLSKQASASPAGRATPVLCTGAPTMQRNKIAYAPCSFRLRRSCRIMSAQSVTSRVCGFPSQQLLSNRAILALFEHPAPGIKLAPSLRKLCWYTGSSVFNAFFLKSF